MVWLPISALGTRRFEIVKGNLNRGITDSRPLSQPREWFPANDCIFVNGGTPCYTAKCKKKKKERKKMNHS